MVEKPRINANQSILFQISFVSKKWEEAYVVKTIKTCVNVLKIIVIVNKLLKLIEDLRVKGNIIFENIKDFINTDKAKNIKEKIRQASAIFSAPLFVFAKFDSEPLDNKKKIKKAIHQFTNQINSKLFFFLMFQSKPESVKKKGISVISSIVYVI